MVERARLKMVKRARVPEPEPESKPLRLDDLADNPRWVVWQEEERIQDQNPIRSKNRASRENPDQPFDLRDSRTG